MPNEPLRATEAARRLGITTREVLVLMREQRIRYVMIDGIAHVPVESIEQYRRRRTLPDQRGSAVHRVGPAGERRTAKEHAGSFKPGPRSSTACSQSLAPRRLRIRVYGPDP